MGFGCNKPAPSGLLFFRGNGAEAAFDFGMNTEGFLFDRGIKMQRLFYTNFTMKIPPPSRRHVFRDAECARRTFTGGGASSAGRKGVTIFRKGR